MKITFIGATEGVTGSKTLLEIDQELILIDSGLYQEGESISDINREKLPFDPKKLKAIIITHAHLDHTGFLPFIYREGFRGPIYLTGPTSKLTRIILSDSGELIGDEKFPLYDLEDAHNVISLFQPKNFSERFFVNEYLSCTFHRASHILGAAFVELHAQGKSIVFSGDLGRYDDPLLAPPTPLVQADYLIMESTYGGKNRSTSAMEEEMLRLMRKIKEEKLNLLIPCFALHRAQMLSFLIKTIFYKYPDLKSPLYLNSPMMEKVTAVYLKFKEEFNFDFNKFNPWEELYFLNDYWDIERVNKTEGPQIILASSGMASGGRVWTHLMDLAPKKDTLIFFPGFLAKDTIGDKIANEEKNILSPTKLNLAINASVLKSDAFSSHAEQNELIKWLNSGSSLPKKIFLIHGEENSKKILSRLLNSDQLEIFIPKKGDSIIL